MIKCELWLVGFFFLIVTYWLKINVNFQGNAIIVTMIVCFIIGNHCNNQQLNTI